VYLYIRNKVGDSRNSTAKWNPRKLEIGNLILFKIYQNLDEAPVLGGTAQKLSMGL
jgi:hypothetical protein